MGTSVTLLTSFDHSYIDASIFSVSIWGELRRRAGGELFHMRPPQYNSLSRLPRNPPGRVSHHSPFLLPILFLHIALLFTFMLLILEIGWGKKKTKKNIPVLTILVSTSLL